MSDRRLLEMAECALHYRRLPAPDLARLRALIEQHPDEPLEDVCLMWIRETQAGRAR